APEGGGSTHGAPNGGQGNGRRTAPDATAVGPSVEATFARMASHVPNRKLRHSGRFLTPRRPPTRGFWPGPVARNYPTRLGKISLMEPRSTASARASISVGSAFRMTTRAPDSLAAGTTPATGHTE